MGNAAVIVGLLLLGRAAQHRLYAGNYLTGTEGFYDIIVGAQLEAQYAVYLLALCGKHYHGYARGLAYLAAHVKTGHLRHHDIQHTERYVAIQRVYCGLAIVNVHHLKALGFKIYSK